MTILPYTYWFDFLTEISAPWRPEDYKCRNVVRGVKQEHFNGYFQVKINGVWRPFDNDNVEEFVRILIPVLGQRLKQDVAGPITIVPIPNSNLTIAASGGFRCVELANMLAKGYGQQAQVVPAIRWKNARDKAHKSNEFRSPEVYEPEMALVESPSSPVLLFDDVLTSGSQMTAAARVLTKAGFPLARGLVVARATKTQETDPFLTKKMGELDLSEYTFDFDKF
jgi:hypothetical protein